MTTIPPDAHRLTALPPSDDVARALGAPYPFAVPTDAAVTVAARLADALDRLRGTADDGVLLRHAVADLLAAGIIHPGPHTPDARDGDGRPPDLRPHAGAPNPLTAAYCTERAAQALHDAELVDDTHAAIACATGWRELAESLASRHLGRSALETRR